MQHKKGCDVQSKNETKLRPRNGETTDVSKIRTLFRDELTSKNVTTDTERRATVKIWRDRDEETRAAASADASRRPRAKTTSVTDKTKRTPNSKFIDRIRRYRFAPVRRSAKRRPARTPPRRSVCCPRRTPKGFLDALTF